LTIDTSGAEVSGRGVGASNGISIEGADLSKDVSGIDRRRAGDTGGSAM
jgi:hypothetical protein